MNALPAAPTPLRIDFVSDVVCPWCAIGLNALEQALQRLGGEISADLHVLPYELNPGMPPGGEPLEEHLQRKYGISAAQLAHNQARIRERGAAVGFVFTEDARRRIVNTFDAHRLLHWAGLEGRQRALEHALLRAYFGQGRDVSLHAALVDIAAGVGLDAGRAAAILASDVYAAEVRLQQQFALRHGIAGVPATVIEGRHLVSGGQPVEVFERALRDVAARKRG